MGLPLMIEFLQPKYFLSSLVYVCMYDRMFNVCHHSSNLIYLPILMQLYTSIGYNITTKEFAFQGDRAMVKVTNYAYFRKTLSSL